MRLVVGEPGVAEQCQEAEQEPLQAVEQVRSETGLRLVRSGQRTAGRGRCLLQRLHEPAAQRAVHHVGQRGRRHGADGAVDRRGRLAWCVTVLAQPAGHRHRARRRGGHVGEVGGAGRRLEEAAVDEHQAAVIEAQRDDHVDAAQRPAVLVPHQQLVGGQVAAGQLDPTPLERSRGRSTDGRQRLDRDGGSVQVGGHDGVRRPSLAHPVQLPQAEPHADDRHHHRDHGERQPAPGQQEPVHRSTVPGGPVG